MPKKIDNGAALNNVLGDFIRSYAERNKSIEFSSWLADRLGQAMPNLPVGMGGKLVNEIIEAVAEYDRTLNALGEAVEKGQSKESWLADYIIESCGDMTYSDAGVRLQQINNDLSLSNSRLMLEEDTAVIVDNEVVDWNEYSLKSKALEIGQQAVMSGLGVAASTIKMNIDSGESISGDIIMKALQDGMETTAGEVKAVVAGAIKTAAENKLTDILPEDTPVEAICGMAGVAVESAEALYDVATGESTATEALDRAGRAGVAAVARIGAIALRKQLMVIPYVGPIISLFAGGLLDHMESPQFTNKVYTVVRDAAKATWEGVKQTSRGVLSGVKNTFKNLLHN